MANKLERVLGVEDFECFAIDEVVCPQNGWVDDILVRMTMVETLACTQSAMGAIKLYSTRR